LKLKVRVRLGAIPKEVYLLEHRNTEQRIL